LDVPVVEEGALGQVGAQELVALEGEDLPVVLELPLDMGADAEVAARPQEEELHLAGVDEVDVVAVPHVEAQTEVAGGAEGRRQVLAEVAEAGAVEGLLVVRPEAQLDVALERPEIDQHEV